jgi:cell division septation protein DedD
MTSGEEREFELVLGNKQLLSLFFLIVVLFGVFFSLGYMVGRSIGPGQTLAAEQPRPAPATPPEAPAPTGRPPADSLESPLERSEPAPSRSPAPVTETQPARAAGEVPPRPAADAAGSAAALAARGLHLQVAAVRVREDAESLTDALRKKGYNALLNDQARDGWYRILLGPFPDERAAQEMRARLEKDGYKSILRKP